MWKGIEDPGEPIEGGPSGPPSQGHELAELKDQFEQQRLITQLKEIIKKTDQSATTVTQEKVLEYANTLTKMKSRAKRHTQGKEKEGDESSKLSTPSSEKVLLLRQQMEQNKVKLAERGKNQKGIEDMVAQVKAQLDDSQQQINLSQTPLNISLFEDRVDYSPQLSSQELYNILLNKDKRINEINNKVSKLQANVMDLQENLKEKDSVIDARTKAITLMSENLSKKGKTTLDALEDTKQQMRSMQENFIEVEEQLKAENALFQSELTSKTLDLQRVLKENDELTLKNSELEKTETALQAKIIELEKMKTSPNSSPSRRSPSKSRKIKKGKFPSKSDKAEDDNNGLIADLEQQLAEKCKQFDEKREEIEKLKKEHLQKLEEDQIIINELKEKECQLLLQIQENQTKISKLTEVTVADFPISNDSVISKLKHQLDESNKNMIKVKAQHKTKVKELNQKIDAFKKISDVNAELVKIENENSKLQMKIAELEVEKGQMQLTMVDSRESTSLDELEATIKELTKKLEDHQETITSQETDNIKYQLELQSLRDKLEQMSNDEVKQELTTVQFEEQFETLEQEKTALQTTIETLEQQIIETNNQLELLKKEKCEIQQKCDNLLQDNADLIDRLEKLSTEKVSSAESIEIVENLTQQEKLELEAYQKSLLPKTSMENLDDSPELNDSVNQLTEETSELLQKIELFTVERREVMEKLELLTEENNQLSLKLKEVENNRDVLVETYEQLQTEKEVLNRKLDKTVECIDERDVEEYKALIEKLKGEIKDLKLKLMSTDNAEDTKSGSGSKAAECVTESEIEEYKALIQIQKGEINELKLKLLSFENDHNNLRGLENKASEERYLQLIADYESLLEQIKEIKVVNHNYNEIIEGNKQELIKYAQLMDNNSKLNDEHDKLKKDLENHEENLSNLKKQHQLDIENFKRQSEMKVSGLTVAVEDYEKELNEKCDVIKHLEYEMKVLHDEKVSIEASLVEKLKEVEIINTEKQQKEVEYERLLKKSSVVTEKSQNAGLEVKVKELETKNKEQLEKMKKIAANLKKKTLDYKDLETKYNNIQQKQSLEIQQSGQSETSKNEEICNLQAQINSTLGDLQSLKQEYAAKNDECLTLSEQQRTLQQENNHIKARNEEITNQLHTYSAQIEDLQNIIREYESQLSSLHREMETLRSSDIAEKDEAIRRLNEDIEALTYNSQTSNNALQMKIHEQEMCIESQEQDLQKYKEQVSKLGECLSEVEERRQSLERKAIDLGHELEDKKSRFIQATENEATLESRLKAVAEMDTLIKQNLEEVQEENNALKKENEVMRQEVASYKKQVNTYNLQLQEFEQNQELTNIMEAQKQQLDIKCRNLENEIKKLNMDLDTLQTETEKTENELQEQLLRYANERKQLMEQLEISGEEIACLMESRNELQRTVDDLNAKLDQQQVDFEETMNQYHNLQQEHKKCLSHLEHLDKTVKQQQQQVKEFQDKESSSPEHIQSLLTQKLQELEHFKNKYVPSPADFFSDNPTEVTLNKDIQELQQKLKEQQPKDEGYMMKIKELEQDIQQRTESLQMNENLLKQLQKDLLEKEASIKQHDEGINHWKAQVDFARNMLEQVEANNFQTLNRNHELEQLVQNLEEQQRIHTEEMETLKQQKHQSQRNQQVQWPETSDDPFDFIQKPPSEQQNIEDVMIKSQAMLAHAGPNAANTQEEILQKVRTLEFMLFNAEQEKENAQIQCAQLSEELGRLIYEREQQQIVSHISKDVPSVSNSEFQMNIESQIVSGDEVSLPPHIPYEQSKDLQQCTSSQAFTEDICMQKHAYQCNPSAFADDDGWGFDIDEAKSDESFIQSTSAQQNPLIGELQEKIRLLNIEKEATLDQLHQANVKSGKLIKKLKEFKARNEQLVTQIKAKSSDDCGLEDAIQEELKTQIANLEKKLKETDAELAKEKLERENYLKRIDVLTAANERFVEMKEKQDIEVLGYQQQNRDLQIQLEQVAWNSDSNEQVVSTSSHSNSGAQSSLSDNSEGKLQELKDTIQELTLDNEDLQAMLEDQTRLRKEAENRAKSVPTGIFDEAQLQAALEEKAKLVGVITMHENDNATIRAEVEGIRSNLSSICDERDAIKVELMKIQDKLQDNYKEKTLMEASLLENGIIIESLKKTIDELNDNLENNQESVKLEKINQQLVAYHIEVEKLNLVLDTERSSNGILQATLTEQQTQMEQYQQTIDGLQNQKQQLQEANLSLEATLDELRKDLQEKTETVCQLQSATIAQETLKQEISRLNGQLLEIPILKEQIQEIGILKIQLKEMDTLKQQLLDQQSEFDLKLVATTEQLAQEWALLVEQRGNDVAESWKLHVDTREKEFMLLEQTLRNENHECEDKCNALLNENNELRRNVDTEIRNEVDRVSALQHQISDRQTQIAKLSDSLQQRSADVDRLSQESTKLIKQLHEYEGRINTNNEQLAILSRQNEEKDRLIETLGNQLQCANDNKISEEFTETQKKELVAKDNEIMQCKSKIDELTMNMEGMAKVKTRLEDNQLQLNELSKEKDRNEKLKLKLEESSLQVTTLHGTLQEKEHRLCELENFLLQQQNDDVSSKIQLQAHVQELQQQIATYAMQLQENNLHINALNEEIESYRVMNNHAQTKEMEIQRLNNLLEEKAREHEYALENQLLESQAVLSSQTQDLDSLKRHLNQTEIVRDEIVMSKDAEIELYKEQLETVNKQLGDYQVESSNSHAKLTEVTGLITDYERQIAEYARQMTELNAIIEGQVLKIEELQGDLYEKSNNYDVLVAEMNNPQELKKQVRFNESSSASTSGNTSSRKEEQEEDLTEPVSRAELDLALYMLHQRDVRCEELTVELLELIGERDTLQLRLSTALREKEEIRSRLPPDNSRQESLEASSSGSGVASGGKAKAILLGATGTEMATEAKEGPYEGQESLANKLSQLKLIGYKKDKTLVDEQDLRRLQQMTLLEHHKNDVSKLPAEAQARLLDASYTLSRDTQSPTKVLLNWFWGKSTPKVNNV